LQAKPTGYTDIPHKYLVAKRLAQCLNPTLPSGVHQKTLELYAYIFSSIGKHGLAHDLNLYLSGLAPALSFASLSVKPTILTLYESYVVKLDAVALRPALKAIILALLPSLEEENSEEFEWTLRILNELKDVVAGGPGAAPSKHQYFWQCMFLASVTSSTRRPGALAYFVRNLPPLTASKAASVDDKPSLKDNTQAVASPEPGLLIRSFCAGLRDEQLLIQRGFLDLLVTHLPLHSEVLQRAANKADLNRLVAAATFVISRRDMSLNRRLWSWFLGPEPVNDVNGAPSPMSPRLSGQVTPRLDTTATQSKYFEAHGLSSLVATVLGMIGKESDEPSERSRPLRLSLALLDRWEIGSLVVPQIFLPALKQVWKYHNSSASKEARGEVLRSANMFFDAAESSLIWSEIAKLAMQALSGEQSRLPTSLEILDFLNFILNNFNVREEEMQVIHMPFVSFYCLVRVRDLTLHGEHPMTTFHEDLVFRTFQFISKLLDLVPTRVLKIVPGQEEQRLDNLHVAKEVDVINSIEHFYKQDQGNVDIGRPVPEGHIGPLLLTVTIDLTARSLRRKAFQSPSASDLLISILGTLVRRGPNALPNVESLVAELKQRDAASLPQTLGESFSTVTARVVTLEVVCNATPLPTWITHQTIRQCVPELVRNLWPALSPSQLKHNVEATRSLWNLQSICGKDKLVESTIVTLMVAAGPEGIDDTVSLEDARRFATLWSHSQTSSSSSHSRRSSLIPGKTSPAMGVTNMSGTSDLSMLERPLMLLLDSLESTKSALAVFVRHWIRTLPTILPVCEILFSKMTPLTANGQVELSDPRTILYYLEKILLLVDIPSASIWQAIRSPVASSIPALGSMNHDFLVEVCLNILHISSLPEDSEHHILFRLKHTALTLLARFFSGPLAHTLAPKELETPLLQMLLESIHSAEHSLQVSLMEVLLPALRMRLPPPTPPKPARHERKASREVRTPSLKVTTDDGDAVKSSPDKTLLPPQLIECLLLGMQSHRCRPVLENWVTFLGQCLPFYEGAIFQILLPMVECFCSTLGDVLSEMQTMFENTSFGPTGVSEPTVGLLLNGLEQTLASAHDYLESEEAGITPIKSPEQQQTGFFGNMVSGVFTNESVKSRSVTANKRLTVLLCFKDAIRICFELWSWGDSGKDSSLKDMSAAASFNYITLRLRNRTRRLFEHLFAVEPLECLETLIDLWQTFATRDSPIQPTVILNLLNALENSRPKNTIPAIFDAIYSRTNPNALDPSRKSTLTSDITDVSLATFLVTYARSLEDDAMDEIWADCSTFLRDVLANPMPHRQTLFKLIEFVGVLGWKVDKTNFGEQRKMRRELGDLFNRLLTATLTIRPIGVTVDGLAPPGTDKLSANPSPVRLSFDGQGYQEPDDLVAILATVAPDLQKILVDSDRIAYTASVISNQVLLPTFRSRGFPANVNRRTLSLMRSLAGIAEASKASKKDVSDAFNDPRFFSTTVDLVKDGWLPILRSWVLADKERMPELLSRLTTPTSAGFLGVGASSARLEADRRTQLNLRRIATLILATPNDAFVFAFPSLQEKIVDLLTATVASSPSSTTRAEIYMLMRALLVKTSTIHLAPLWPSINAELVDALSSAYPDEAGNDPMLPPLCMLQACKLLDTLLVLGLDDFQMQEWLFISDTTDAVYRPQELESVALVDDLTEVLDSESGHTGADGHIPSADASNGTRKPILTERLTSGVPRDELMTKVIRPFMRQLSIQAFESTYGMLAPDVVACEEDLVRDLFDEETLV
jgi:hypothetical protein